MAVILITGAAGRIGGMLRPRLARPDRTLRLLDSARVEPGPGEEAVQASATDLEAMTKACQGADAVIHLAAQAGEAPWGALKAQVSPSAADPAKAALARSGPLFLAAAFLARGRATGSEGLIRALNQRSLQALRNSVIRRLDSAQAGHGRRRPSRGGSSATCRSGCSPCSLPATAAASSSLPNVTTCPTFRT